MGKKIRQHSPSPALSRSHHFLRHRNGVADMPNLPDPGEAKARTRSGRDEVVWGKTPSGDGGSTVLFCVAYTLPDMQYFVYPPLTTS